MPYERKKVGTVIEDTDDYTIIMYDWNMVGQCVAMTPVQTFSVHIKKLNTTVFVENSRSQHKAREMCIEIRELYT